MRIVILILTLTVLSVSVRAEQRAEQRAVPSQGGLESTPCREAAAQMQKPEFRTVVGFMTRGFVMGATLAAAMTDTTGMYKPEAVDRAVNEADISANGAAAYVWNHCFQHPSDTVQRAMIRLALEVLNRAADENRGSSKAPQK